ncbi:alpha-amylase family glycosyl hydrolase [Actinoplanes sp. NPDC049548]|uniref:pullulanase X25 domain-containing protein n=1 Tax=Actinoplanes sp. NPDC049548 TaxID=3155152 RepID=UPI00342D72DD
MPFPHRPGRTVTGWIAASVLIAAGVLQARVADAAPATVTVAGSFTSELGCAQDWDLTCAPAQLSARPDGSWSATITVPAGSYAYKAALNGSWAENYGAHAVADGPDIPLVIPTGGRAVTFLYDPVTHWVTDTVNAAVVTAAGSFQSELGCPADWAADCLRSWLQDVDGDGTYTFTTTAVPPGTWEVKATVGLAWAENYGQDGVAGGANIAFTVAAAGDATTFSYTAGTHRLSATSATDPLDTLGAIYRPSATTFRIWSPDSSAVTVDVGGTVHPLTRTDVPGYTDVYQVVVTGDLRGRTYQFRINGTAVRDPYAQMVEPGTTRGIVVNDAAVLPTGGTWADRPALVNREDAVVYELHVRDFTIDASSGVDPAKRGKFLGLVQAGTTNNGRTTGLDHLRELGVTHVHLMPAFDFSTSMYNWGYDPANYNVPEEQYSQYTAPEDRIREFKDMVNGFHRAGIRVVMDVVYNHTFSKDALQAITPRYYTPADLSGTGNSLDDGNPMVARMIRDSLEHWVRTYNVDGFRFDLLGVHRAANAAAWGTHLTTRYADRNLLLYGEPWCGACTDPDESAKVRYGTVPTLGGAHIGVFNGTYRDAVKGGTRDRIMNYMGGAGNASAVALGTRGSPLATKSTGALPDLWAPAFAYDPEQSINYVSAHDDLNLYDKITYSGASGGAAGRAGQIDKFAAGIVLTSQGIPFLAEGDEFLRSKVVGGDYETAMNSYRAPDAVNAVHWGDKTTNAAVFAYYRDAIAARKSIPALRLTSWDSIRNQVSAKASGSVVVTSISGNAAAPTDYDTVVVYNPGTSGYTATLPPGTWHRALDSSGATDAAGTTCAALSVTVFRKG